VGAVDARFDLTPWSSRTAGEFPVLPRQYVAASFSPSALRISTSRAGGAAGGTALASPRTINEPANQLRAKPTTTATAIHDDRVQRVSRIFMDRMVARERFQCVHIHFEIARCRFQGAEHLGERAFAGLRWTGPAAGLV
jgi:hypothetical protein